MLFLDRQCICTAKVLFLDRQCICTTEVLFLDRQCICTTEVLFLDRQCICTTKVLFLDRQCICTSEVLFLDRQCICTTKVLFLDRHLSTTPGYACYRTLSGSGIPCQTSCITQVSGFNVRRGHERGISRTFPTSRTSFPSSPIQAGSPISYLVHEMQNCHFQLHFTCM